MADKQTDVAAWARLLARSVGVLFYLTTLLPGTALGGSTYQDAWVRQFGSSDFENLSGIAVDRSGNVYVAGNTAGAVEEGSLNAGSSDIFLGKYNGAGDKLWLRQLGTATEDYASEIAVDNSGGLYFAGATKGAVKDGTNLGEFDLLVAKIDPATGNELWAKQFGSTKTDFPRALALDGSGNVYVTGLTRGIFEEGFIKSDPYDDIFILKLDVNGNKLWTRQLQRNGVSDIAIDGSGGVYITGTTRGPLDDAEPFPATSNRAFLAKFHGATGEKLWIKPAATAQMLQSAAGQLVLLDGEGNAFVLMDTDGAFYMSKLNAATGDILWARQLDVVTSTYPSGAIMVGDSIIVTGYSYDTSIDIPYAQMFLGEYSAATGDNLWQKLVGGFDWNDYGSGLASDKDGNIYIAGATDGIMEQGKANIGGQDSFIAKLSAAAISPAEQMARLLSDFDRQVATGTIVGVGSGNSAEKRKNALWSKLLTAQALITDGSITQTCLQLADVASKMNGEKPRDFVQGPGVAVIAAEVTSLERSLGCP